MSEANEVENEIKLLQEANARGEIPMLIVDRLPSDWSTGDLVTRVTKSEVVVWSPSMLWIANRVAESQEIEKQ